jgi:two-component system, LuxR family, sensor kinase FixL
VLARPARLNSILTLAAALALPASAGAIARPPRPTRILLLYQQQAEAPQMVEFTQRLRATIQNELSSPVEFFQEALDLDRFATVERVSRLAGYFEDKYRGFEVDAVIPIGGRALEFAVDHLSGVFPGAPFVFALAAVPQTNPSALPSNVTGRLAVASRFEPTLSMALGLQPDAGQVVVVGGASATDSQSVAAVNTAIADMGDTIHVSFLQGLALDSLLGRLRSLPRRSVVILANFRRDGRGQVFDPVDIVGSLSRASVAPMYTQLRSYIGEGVVGGFVTRFDDEGVRTGRLVVRVLGRRPGERMPPVEIVDNSFVADWRQMRRFGLSEARLPPGTDVLFREATAWERYRTVATVTLGLIAAESVLIGLLLLERRRRKRIQAAVHEQAVYERTMAALTTDAVRHAPDEAPEALEDALARIGQYAGASAATLTQYPETSTEPQKRLSWVVPADDGRGERAPVVQTSSDSPLAIPLVADGAIIGSLELRRSDGQEWPSLLTRRLDSAGKIVASAIARSRADRAIRHGEELNRAVLASLSAEIAILDRDGTIIRVNDAWRGGARFGEVETRSDAFVGWNYLEECRRAETRGCEDAGKIRRGLEAVLEGREWPFRHEYRWSTPDERAYEIFVDRLQVPEGGAIVTHLDITDRRLAERRAEETRRQVAHMGRLALVGELSATMSHELRQPLAAIRANAEAGVRLLTFKPPDLGEVRDIFRSIVADNMRAAEVIEGVRKLLRKDEMLATTVDLNQICQESVRLLQHEAALRETRLELSLSSANPTVAGDPVQLQQVILNLMLNGLEAASTSSAERAVVIGIETNADGVEVTVHDTGPGLSANVHPRLFDPFFSTKTGGLGLGLVIVRSIVERHNGRVRAENHSLGGALFSVRLPATPVGSASA